MNASVCRPIGPLNTSKRECQGSTLYLATMTKAQRQRLINAIFYFAKYTKFAGQTKLLKLLYLLDFEHFKQTGRSVTGLEYQAWRMGPVPKAFRSEWKSGFSPDLAALVTIQPEETIHSVRETVVPNEGAEFDEGAFTPRQLALLEDIATTYRDKHAQQMVDITHTQNEAWDKVWRDGKGQNDVIPYELSLAADCGEREDILQAANEYRGFVAAIRNAGH